jgi:multiple sugar transport system substrate-binding protein
MSRPQSEAEYLAGLVPPSVAGTSLSRRSLLMGAGAALGLPALLAACGGSSGGGSGTSGAPSGSVTFGSYYSDAVPKKAIADVLTAFQTATPGVKVPINTVEHNSFQENINNYLQGKPDDVFTWFAGYRMRFFASKGLAGDISDVWTKLSGFSDAFKQASTGDDGKQYFVPLYNYPWAVFYRPSLFKKNGYEVPKTLDELVALSKKMRADGLVPIGFADKDGWPAMGTFDILNMRINGYKFHVDLMAGKQAWTSPQVKKVFDTWTQLIPYQQQGSLGRTWQEAAQGLQQKKTGMYLLGAFVAQQVDNGKDLDFFPFPEIDSTIGADAIDAPIDGFMLAHKPKNETAAKALLTYLGGPDAGAIYAKSDPSNVLANSNASTATYSDFQKKCAELIKSSKSIAQFLDRDTRPDFASTVMIPSLQSFIKSPTDATGILSSIEKQKASIFTS